MDTCCFCLLLFMSIIVHFEPLNGCFVFYFHLSVSIDSPGITILHVVLIA